MPSNIEILVVAAIFLLVFGASWLPKVARRAGVASRETAELRGQLGEAHETIKKADRYVGKALRVGKRF